MLYSLTELGLHLDPNIARVAPHNVSADHRRVHRVAQLLSLLHGEPHAPEVGRVHALDARRKDPSETPAAT